MTNLDNLPSRHVNQLVNPTPWRAGGELGTLPLCYWHCKFNPNRKWPIG